MSTLKKPVPGKGWMRALFFLVVFTGIYLLGRWFYTQTSMGATIEAVYAGAAIFAFAALVTVPVFRAFVDKKPFSSLGFRWKMSDTSSADESNNELTNKSITQATHKSHTEAINKANSESNDKANDKSNSEANHESKNEANHGLIGASMAMAILGLGWLTLYLTNHLEYYGVTFSPGDLTTGFILMCIIAIAEEAVFRGYMLNNLLESFDPWLALVISAMLFALLHSGNPEAGILAIFNVFLAGIFLGISYIHTRNLWFAIFFHLSWNFLQGPILGFPVSGLELPALIQVTISGNEQITGGKFGFEASLIQTVLFIISILVLYLYYRNRIPASSIDNPHQEQAEN